MDDPRAEPQYGERVPYVVKAGAPGARLMDRVVSPEEMLKDRCSWFCDHLANTIETCASMQNITFLRRSYLHWNEYSTWLVQMFEAGMKTCQR